ncbi:Conserved_hypothetical protein [Hexamita inflata]|uniref:Transmembrane protein n=1 Tax=Hexamita inflata TaxID=28002 RepID=A0AA86TVY5_9EUKA|nr:Conserved hypothetical protein [Hexamita inflata]
MILLAYIYSQNVCIKYEGNSQSNPIIVIEKPQAIEFAYLAYKINYKNIDTGNFQLKYIYTSVPAEQSRIEVTVYGQILEICSSEADNIKLLSSVSQVTNLSNFNNLEILSDNIVFIDLNYRACYFGQLFINIASNSHGQLLDLYQGKPQDWSTFTFKEYTCEKRIFIDIKPETGVISVTQNDVIFPVYNPNLSLYNKDYGNYLYPEIRVQNQTHAWLIQAPCNPLKKGDQVMLSESILFGEHSEYIQTQNIVQILVGVPIEGQRPDGFENISILNKCVQFYANSPRDIEYPLGSGIIFNIRTEIQQQQEEGYYSYFYGPYICVDNFTYMPAMFYTWEDPALKHIFTNLTNINDSFEEMVINKTWPYLTNDVEADQQAIGYTRSILQAIQDMCLKAYFSDNFLINLSKCLIFIFCPLIGINIVMKIVIKEKSKGQALDYILSILAFVALVVILLFTDFSIKVQFSSVIGIGLLYIFVRGLCYYQIVESLNDDSEQNNNSSEPIIEASKQQIQQKRITFWIQYIVQALIKILDIIQTVTDIMQILQYLQIQFYSNRVSNLFYLIYPSEKMLYAAEYLAESTAYPIILLGFSLINQEIMKQEWFKQCIKPSADPLDNKTFLIKMIIQVFGYFQGFVYNVFFAFTDTKLNFDFIKNEQVKYNVQEIVKIYLSGTIYSISKFQLILEYYQQINKAIIKIFVHLVQMLTNLLLIISSSINSIKYIIQCNNQAVKIQMKIMIISILKLIYYTIMLVVDPIVTVFLPTSLMFQELTKLCPFLLQVFGICDHQDEFAKQTGILLTTNIDQFFQSILSSIEVYGICIFFGLLFSKNQTISIAPLDQWQAIFFGIVAFITPYICKNSFGGYIMKQLVNITHHEQISDNIVTNAQTEEIVEVDIEQLSVESLPIQQHDSLFEPKIDFNTKEIEQPQQLQATKIESPTNCYKILPFSLQYKTIELQNELTEAQCQYHKSLLNVRGDYKHEASYYEDFLNGLIFTGYGVIPGFGIILATVAKYMNNNGFASDGECITQKSRKEVKRHIWNVINDLCLLVFIILGIWSALCSDIKPFYLTIIGLFIFIFYYQLLDEQLEEAYQHNADYYLDSCKKKNKEQRENKMEKKTLAIGRSFEDNKK